MVSDWLKEVFENSRKSLEQSKDWRALAGIEYKHPFNYETSPDVSLKEGENG